MKMRIIPIYHLSLTDILNNNYHFYFTVPPRILEPSAPYNATEGEIISIPCPSYAKPPARIRWSRITSKRNQVEDVSRYMMYNGSLLLKTSFLDSGTYVCEAENEVGEAKIEVILNVFGKLVCIIKQFLCVYHKQTC